MSQQSPFVVVISAPAAGVGKSTLASNLAVYLKGLAEDLPVAYLPLDSKGAPDEMFSLGCPARYSVADLERQGSFAQLLSFGQFGVEYCTPIPADCPAPEPDSLRHLVGRSDYSGLLILDVSAQSPYWQAAIWAADLLLVPVKDPASFASLSSFRRELIAGGGEEGQLWLLPSHLGELRRVQPHLELEAFLRFAADERGFQVLQESLPAEPVVREQATSVSHSVLTRAPESQTHRQLRQLAELLLAKRQNQDYCAVRLRRAISDGQLPSRARRIAFNCPLCGQAVQTGEAHYLESAPARKRILLHRACFAQLLEGLSAAAFQDDLGLQLLQPGEASGGTAGQLRLQLVDADGEPLDAELFSPVSVSGWAPLLLAATGRRPAELYAETILISEPQPVSQLLDDGWYQRFMTRRRQLRMLCEAEKI